MTKKIFSILMLAAVLFWAGCQPEEDLSPIATFDKSTKGAYPRLLSLSIAELDLQDFATPIEYTVEFVTLDQGDNVTEYRVEVSFKDNNPANGDMTASAAVFQTATQADFTENANGFKEITVTLGALEMADLLGINSDDFEAGDYFELNTIITLDDGNSYSFDNTTSAINQGGAFAAFFRQRFNLTCPVPDERFVGDYQISYVEEPSGGFGPIFGAEPPVVTVSTVEGSSTMRQFSTVYLPDLGIGQPAATFEFDLVCDETIFGAGQGTNLGCGGTITLGPGEENGTFDFEDDSEIILNINEFEGDGGCGSGPVPVTIMLTKI